MLLNNSLDQKFKRRAINMALFEGNRRKPGTRSNTKLVVSGGDSPAERWKVKQDLPKLFDYPYGGPGQTDVIISKGMMVAIDSAQPLVKNYDNDRLTTQITIADGKNNVIGMAPYNFCREVDDRFTGNQPSIICKEYVELPYFPDSDDAKNCLWGNASGDMQAGDFVKVSTDPELKGRLVKWEEGDSVLQICGQVLAKEPLGSDYDFLEWVMWDERYKKEEDSYINKTGYSAPGIEGYPFDPEINNKDGFTADEQGYLSPYTSTATGIPGITDGANAANTLLTRTLGMIATGTTAGTALKFIAQKNLIEGTVVVKIDGTDVDASKLNIDHKKGIITYTLDADAAADSVVTAEYKAHHYGLPAHQDFTGADGVVRILLKF